MCIFYFEWFDLVLGLDVVLGCVGRGVVGDFVELSILFIIFICVEGDVVRFWFDGVESVEGNIYVGDVFLCEIYEVGYQYMVNGLVFNDEDVVCDVFYFLDYVVQMVDDL